MSFVLLLGAAGCLGDAGEQSLTINIQPASLQASDIEQGRELLQDYGCGSCHTIPGVPGANSYVGPPLNNWSQRNYIAGSLPNTLDNLVPWIQNPRAIEPDTAMPVLGVSPEEARQMGAYLYSLGN